MKKQHKLIAVDLQNYFTDKNSGLLSFLEENIFPFIKEKNIKINEIVSDYRQPRPGDTGDCCHPDEWGYESVVPREIVNSVWIKCMNSPIWIRENIGIANKEPGLPYPDSDRFGEWLEENIGKPESVIPVLFGLTVDCCVLSTAQELAWRGYSPIVIKEGVAHSSGKIEDKDKVFETPLPNWANIITWGELKNEL